MGHSYTGRQCPPGNLSLWPGLTIAKGGTGYISWSWTGQKPPLWDTYESLTGTSGWSLINSHGPTPLQCPGCTAGRYYYTQGVASDHSPMTIVSNTLLMT